MSSTTTPHTLHLGNLSFAIEEDDVRDFFKDVGEIAQIRFAIRDDKFLGFAHVQFTTAQAAQQALKLNNELILDRRIKLEFSRPRIREGNRYNECTTEKSTVNESGGTTVYIRGFDSTHGFDNIRSALEKHFGNCGEISRMSIPKDYDSGEPRGVAFIEFADRNGFNQAVGLHGSEIGGSRLIVEEAKKQKVDCREGSGYGRDWRGESGSGNGPSNIWVRDSSSSRQSGSGRDWRGASGSSSSWHTESGSCNDWRRESGHSSTFWHRESGSNSGRGRETGFASNSSGRGSGSNSGRGRETGFASNSSGRGSGSNSGWDRETSFGSSSSGRGSGSSTSWHRESGSSSTYRNRESNYNGGRGRETSFASNSSGRGSGSSSSWHREHVSRRSGYCPGENISSGGWGRLRDSGGGGWRGGISSKQPYHPYR